MIRMQASQPRGGGSQRLGCRMEPCHPAARWQKWFHALFVPSPGFHLTEQTLAEHRKAPMLSTSESTAVGAIPGQGISPDGERTRGVPAQGTTISQAAFPAETSLGVWPEATEGAQREPGRIPGKPQGQLWKAPDSWVLLPSSACLPWLCSSSISRELAACAPTPGSAPGPSLHRLLLS